MFLDSSNYLEEVSKLIRTSSELKIAIAFWGKDADKIIESAGSKKIKIICNLNSGGTNPDPIKKLSEMSNIQIRQLDDLHAKVIIGEKCSIIGSANMSTNGLGNELDEAAFWQEAGYRCAEKKSLAQSNTWFDELWSNAKVISNSDLIRAANVWENRRAFRLSSSTKTSLFSQNRAFFKDRKISLVLYEEHAPKETEKKFYEIAKKVEPNRKEIDKKFDFYENGDVFPKDEVLISVLVPQGKKIKIEGIYKRYPKLDQKFLKKDNTQNSIQFLSREKKIETGDAQTSSFVFDRNTKQSLANYLEKHREFILKKAGENMHLRLYDALEHFEFDAPA